LKDPTHPFSSDFDDGSSLFLESGCKTRDFKMTVNCLVLDYDGTISPLSLPRNKSRVPVETQEVLQEIGKLIPIVIVTTKDLSFVEARTPFACAWSGVGGLERKVGHVTQKRPGYEYKLRNVSVAIEYARRHMNLAGVEVEEKRDMNHRCIAFCLDWRRAEDSAAALKGASAVADYCESLGLMLVRIEGQPFLDVYPMSVDKGLALRELLKELKLKKGILYMGDSEVDNPAFAVADVGVGVVHGENYEQDLVCDYFVKFEDVSTFLRRLLENRLLFEYDFPMLWMNAKEEGRDA
jgi:trehalose-phosphatase